MVEIVQKNVNAQFASTNMQRWTQLNSNETTELSLDQQIKCSIKHLLFQMWIEIQINIRYVHLTSPQPCYVGVDVIGWLLSCFSLSLFFQTLVRFLYSVWLSVDCHRFYVLFTSTSIKTMIVLVCISLSLCQPSREMLIETKIHIYHLEKDENAKCNPIRQQQQQYATSIQT